MVKLIRWICHLAQSSISHVVNSRLRLVAYLFGHWAIGTGKSRSQIKKKLHDGGVCQGEVPAEMLRSTAFTFSIRQVKII